MSYHSIKRRVEKMQEALCDRREPDDIVERVIGRAIARVDDESLKRIHGALVRDVFSNSGYINFMDLPEELLTPEEVEAFGQLREVLEEELGAT